MSLLHFLEVFKNTGTRQRAACHCHPSWAGAALPAGPRSPASRDSVWEDGGDRKALGWDPMLRPDRWRGREESPSRSSSCLLSCPCLNGGAWAERRGTTKRSIAWEGCFGEVVFLPVDLPSSLVFQRRHPAGPPCS